MTEPIEFGSPFARAGQDRDASRAYREEGVARLVRAEQALAHLDPTDHPMLAKAIEERVVQDGHGLGRRSGAEGCDVRHCGAPGR